MLDSPSWGAILILLMPPKFFTVDQANRTLPLVRRIVTDVVSAHRELQELAASYSDLDPKGPTVAEPRAELRERIDGLTNTINRYIGELHELGCLFKGFEEGLVDFYALKGARPVFLCWKLGEERIEWWHETDAGFAGRQPLATLLD